ncbi:MAG TPA: hypothetical protein EYP05_08520 [Piscirickettsiaceae bacterium]|nr:hypothetical protein [Piscirickettsiaceae bacterium]HIQ41066.1 hypothetical protein [Sulfurivirga caldicuralii]
MVDTLLIFRIGDMLLGLDSDQVTRVQRVPVMTDVPLGEGALKGIAVIDGRIVPVLDMGMLLDQQPVDQTAASARLVVMQSDHEALGFLVDGIEQTVSLDDAVLSAADDTLKGVVGVYDLEGVPVQVIEPHALQDQARLGDFCPVKVPFPLPQQGVQPDESAHTARQAQLFLHFVLGDEHFALSTDCVGELLQVPEEFTALVGAPMPPVLGLSPLRGEMVTVLDLADYLGLGRYEHSPHARLIVLTDGDQQLAVAVPRVYEVMEVDIASIQPIRSSEATQQRLPVSGVFRQGDGTIVSVLGDTALKQLLDAFALTAPQSTTQQVLHGDDTQMVELAVFRLGDEIYALDIEQVQEIIKYQPITPIPEPPQYVEGIINLRGKVIPVINLAERLGFTFEPDERSKIVVGLHEGNQVGLLVNDVDEILYVDESDCAYSDDPDSLIHATVTLDSGRRVILWLKLAKVLSGIRFGQIKQ